jgi:hypothetical protein
MRYSWLVIVFFGFATLTSAAPPVVDRDADIRALEYRLYDRVDFPLRLRRIDNEITLAEARQKSLEKLLKEYQSFQKFSIGNPLTLTVEDTKLQLLELKLQIESLREERSLMHRYKDEQRRLFELRGQARAGQ